MRALNQVTRLELQGSDPSRSSRDSKMHVPNCKGLTLASLDVHALCA